MMLILMLLMMMLMLLMYDVNCAGADADANDINYDAAYNMITFWHIITSAPDYRNLPFWSTENST